MASKKGSANLPVAYDAELAAMAEAYKANEAASATGQFISFKGGVMTYRGAAVEGNKLDVIILSSIFENVWYEKDFDPNSPAAPQCYAFGKSMDELKPHDASSDKQGDANGLCAGCWANGWGSDPKGGRGKACRNTRRLAVIPAKPLDVDAIPKAELAFMKLPVTSVAAYSAHAIQCADVLKKPPFGVVTTIGVVPDAKNQFRVTFTAAAEIKDKGLLVALMQRAKAAESSIVFPYPEMTEEAPPARRGAPAGRNARPAPATRPPARNTPQRSPATRQTRAKY
jgi:hypothetical protein